MFFLLLGKQIDIMLYGTEGGGRGRKSKYMLLPRGGRVKFDFLNASPRPVARSIGLGRLVNWTRPPGR